MSDEVLDASIRNILERSLAEMVASDRQRGFGQDKRDTRPQHCRDCEVLFACYGECPRNRLIRTPGGELGLNYLCDGDTLFFRHVAGPMTVMANLLRQGRAAAEVMRLSY